MNSFERWLAEAKSFAFLALHAEPQAPLLTWTEAMAWATEHGSQ